MEKIISGPQRRGMTVKWLIIKLIIVKVNIKLIIKLRNNVIGVIKTIFLIDLYICKDKYFYLNIKLFNNIRRFPFLSYVFRMELFHEVN